MRFKQMQYLSTILSAAILLFLINPAFANSAKNKNRTLSNNAPQQSGTDPQPDLLIKSSSEPDTSYQTDNAYQQVPSDQQIKTVESVKGKPVTFQVKIQNDSDNPQSYYLKTIESADTGWMVNYTIDSSSNIINTFAGGGDVTVDGVDAKLYCMDNHAPGSVVFDHNRNLYVGSYDCIWRIDASNKICRIAGNGTLTYSGDGGPAIDAGIPDVKDMVFDLNDNLYFSDSRYSRIRRIDAKTGIISTIAGTGVGGFSGDGGPATMAQLNGPTALAVDSSGNIFIADTSNNRIRKIDAATLTISTVVGTGDAPTNGDDYVDGIAASQAKIGFPRGIALDSSNNLYISEGSILQKVYAATGLIQTIAGNLTTYGHSGDGGPASLATLTPYKICLDEDSNIYISEAVYIRKINAKTGIITSIAGDGTSGFSGDGGPAVLAKLNAANGIAAKDHGTIYLADSNNKRVRRIESATTIQYALASGGYTTNVIPAHESIVIDVTMIPTYQAMPNTTKSVIIQAFPNSTDTMVFDSVEAIASLPLFSEPDLLIKGQSTPDLSYKGNLIYEESPSYSQSVFQQILPIDTANYSVMLQNKGDKTQSFLLKSVENTNTAWNCSYSVKGVDITANIIGKGYSTPVMNPGDTFVFDIIQIPAQNAIGLDHKISTMNVYNDINDTSVEDSVMANSSVSSPDLSIKGKSDPDINYETSGTYQQTPSDKQIKSIQTTGGNPASFSIYLQNYTRTPQSYYLRTKESADTGWTVKYSIDDNFRRITTYAGGSANTADITDAKDFPYDLFASIAYDHLGNLYVGGKSYIWRIDSNKKVHCVAGNEDPSFLGDGGLATDASVASVFGIAFDANNNLYFTDRNRVRRIDAATGIINTIAGNGNPDFSGDGNLATNATLNSPTGIAIDSSGNIYISDSNNNRIRKIDASTQIISTYAGTGTTTYNGDSIAASQANLYQPFGMTMDSSGNLYIAESRGARIRKINMTTGLIQSVAGNGLSGDGGDGGPAIQASINSPNGICLDKDSNIYFSEQLYIREIDAKTGIITTIAGKGTTRSSGDGGPAIQAVFKGITGIAIRSDGSLMICDYPNSIRMIESATAIQDALATGGYDTSTILAYRGIVIDAELTPAIGLPKDSKKSVIFEVYSNNTDTRVIDSVKAVSQTTDTGAEGTTYNAPAGFIKSGWNLISLPADPTNADPLNVFTGIDVANSYFQYWNNEADPSDFQYYGSAYGWTGPVVRGTPYWFKSPSDITLSYLGSNSTFDFVMTVPAHTAAPYWIAVGTPFPSAVSADAILFKDTSRRGDNWLTWSDAYSTSNTDLRIVDSSMQGWDNTQGSYIRIAPPAFATASDKTQFDPWWGYWLLVTDKNELQIKFPKPIQ